MSTLLGVHADNQAYGYRRLATALQWGHSKTRRLMAASNIVPLGVKKNRYASTKGVPPEPQTIPDSRRNLLKERQLTAQYFGHIWAEDFTYLYFHGTWYYVATIIDLYSRQIVGWALSSSHATDLIVDALFDALERYDPPDILHQDQGSEYCSERYDVILLAHGIEASFSQKGHPWENGHQESFYRYFKIELGATQLDRFQDISELYEAIAKQLHYYNQDRIHSALDMSPLHFLHTAQMANKDASKTETETDQSRNSTLSNKKLQYYWSELQQMVTGVRDKVFRKMGA